MELSNQIQKDINLSINKLQAKFSDITPVLEYISALVSGAIDRNFDQQGRWDGSSSNISIFSGGSQRWKPLAKSTKESYKKLGYALEPTLNRNKFLKSTIEVRPQGSNKIVITTNAPYAAIHQFGGTLNPVIPISKKMRKFFWAKFYETNDSTWKFLALTKNKQLKPIIKIPARPFLTLTDEDFSDIKDVIGKYIQST